MNIAFRSSHQRSLPLFFIRTQRLLLPIVLSAGLVLSSWAIAPQALAADAASPPPTAIPTEPAPTAATLFELNCAGCHANGGNIIRRGKNLKKKAMERNGYGDVEAITQIITNGKGIMSAYSDRLNEEEIGAIAQYVHEQSETGW